MKNILVTGCAGFIGFHLCERLIAQGFSVHGVDNLYQDINLNFKNERLKRLLNKGLYFHQVDLLEKEVIKKLIKFFRFDTIIHLAARTGVRTSIKNPLDFINANISGYCNLCEAAKENESHLIYASSSSVYGNNNEFPFRESHRTDEPISIYAATKKADELLAYYYASNFGMQITGLRFFTVYGPWNRKDMAVYLFMDAISKGRPIRLFNEGQMKRDFTFVNDITEAIYRLVDKDKFLLKPLPRNAIYNIGYGSPVTLQKLVNTIEENLGKKAVIEYQGLQPGDMVNTWADNSTLSQLIGYKPKVSIEEGIKHTAKWFQSEDLD